MDEIFLPIIVPIYCERYHVSNLGRILHLEHKIDITTQWAETVRTLPERILKPFLDQRHNWLVISLRKPGDSHVKICLMHKLVAWAHLPNPENLTHIRHLDGNKLNNRVDNLQWVTHKQQMELAQQRGSFENRDNSMKLSFGIANEIRQRHGAGESQNSLAGIYGCSQSHVNNIIHNRTWLRDSRHKKTP